MNEHGARQGPRPAGNSGTVAALGIFLAIGFLTAACANNPSPTQGLPSAPGGPVSRSNAPTTAPVSEGPTTPSIQPVRMIVQPPAPTDVAVAPDSARVDLAMPTFSNPTNITNPLFPVSRQESVLMLGRVDGKPFRTEVTLLPFTRIVDWEGQRVEAVVSQYLAYLDWRVTEIAYDLYAQADDGSVWYFGEDVSDFADGAIVSKEGTWLTGKDAPAAMIMPANPKVGDVYRTENSPGFVFEEVTVKSVGQALQGPLGAVPGGLVIRELHMDGTTEDKTFAPGYGEFLTAGGGDVEALALAVPADAAGGSPPAELTTLDAGATAVFTAATSSDWKKALAEVEKMTTAWKSYRVERVPKLIEPRMTAALETLGRAVAARDARKARQAAIDAAHSSLDLLLRYRPATEIDLARLGLWAAQVQVDAAAKNHGAVRGDTFTLVYIRDRIMRSLTDADLLRIDTQLRVLQIAALDGDLPAAAGVAARLREIVAGLQR
jgi:hypothetical protein